MSKIILGIVEKISYARKFAECVGRDKSSIIEVKIFSELSIFCECCVCEKIDTVLIGQDFFDENCTLLSDVCTIILTDGTDEKYVENYPVIFKYQPVDEIVRQIMSILSESDRIGEISSNVSLGECEIIGVFSPFGGAGVSCYAYELCKNTLPKSLYINLEAIDGMGREKGNKTVAECSYERGMSEVIFYIRQQKNKLALKLRSVISRIGDVDTILPVEDFRDIYNMTVSDMGKFLEILVRESGYERFVFDIGYLGDSAFFLMKKCDRLIFPIPYSEHQINKKNSFEKLLLRDGMADVLAKIEYVKMGEYPGVM